MLADLIDPTPAVELADGLVSDCRERAARAGVDVTDADALHTWAIERANGREPVVERAMAALFKRDAAWGAANLEQDPFGRYTWEVAAEVAGEPRDMGSLWTYGLGVFKSCGTTFEVVIHRPGGHCCDVPHLHVRMQRHPGVPDVCVGLYEAVYVPFGHRHWELDRRHREDLADFLEELRYPGEGWPRWYDAENTWERACEMDGRERPPHIGFEAMPDYRLLHWPDGEGASA